MQYPYKGGCSGNPIIYISSFFLLNYFCDDLNKMVATFWWNESNSSLKIHWLSWDKLCTPKCEGSSGFRNMYAFDLGMLAKQRWRIIVELHSLVAQTLKAKYFPNTSFLVAKVKSNVFFGWRRLCVARPVIDKGSCWQISTEESTRIWENQCLRLPSLFKIYSPRPFACTLDQVSQMMHQNPKQWNVPLLKSLFSTIKSVKLLH